MLSCTRQTSAGYFYVLNEMMKELIFIKLKKTFSLLLISVLLCCVMGCDITVILPGGPKPEEQQEKEMHYEGPPPVISIDDDAKSVITEETTEPEEPEYEEIYDPEGKQYSAKAASPDEITLAFVGDVGFAQGYATINKYRSNGSDIHNSISDEVLSIMESADIMMANNEFPYSDRGTPIAGKTYTFRADPKDVHIMKDMGVDIVSLANNHAFDYGADALIDTVDTLNDAKLPFVGAGKNFEEASHPVYFHVNGKVISYVSATQIERYGNPETREATADSPGVLRTLDPAKAVKAIEEADASSDFVVMYVHWGSESTDLVEKSQRDLAKAYVDAGADLIIGDHSHCLQGIDYVDGVPVFFSLGNFWFNSKTLDTCIVRATLDDNCGISSLEFIPCIQRGSGVVGATPAERERIIEYMRGISNYADIDDDGYVTKSDKDNNRQNGQNTSPAKKAAPPAEDNAAENAVLPAAEEPVPVQDVQQETQPQEEKSESLPDWAVDVSAENGGN